MSKLPYEDWLREIEDLRNYNHCGRLHFTREQDILLVASRAYEPIVSWERIAKWWAMKGWAGKRSAIRMRWMSIEGDEKYLEELKQEIRARESCQGKNPK